MPMTMRLDGRQRQGLLCALAFLNSSVRTHRGRIIAGLLWPLVGWAVQTGRRSSTHWPTGLVWLSERGAGREPQPDFSWGPRGLGVAIMKYAVKFMHPLTGHKIDVFVDLTREQEADVRRQRRFNAFSIACLFASG
jgi:hypothetical protein